MGDGFVGGDEGVARDLLQRRRGQPAEGVGVGGVECARRFELFCVRLLRVATLRGPHTTASKRGNPEAAGDPACPGAIAQPARTARTAGAGARTAGGCGFRPGDRCARPVEASQVRVGGFVNGGQFAVCPFFAGGDAVAALIRRDGEHGGVRPVGLGGALRPCGGCGATEAVNEYDAQCFAAVGADLVECLFNLGDVAVGEDTGVVGHGLGEQPRPSHGVNLC